MNRKCFRKQNFLMNNNCYNKLSKEQNNFRKQICSMNVELLYTTCASLSSGVRGAGLGGGWKR